MREFDQERITFLRKGRDQFQAPIKNEDKNHVED